MGKPAVAAFVTAFDIPGLEFVALKVVVVVVVAVLVVVVVVVLVLVLVVLVLVLVVWSSSSWRSR